MRTVDFSSGELREAGEMDTESGHANTKDATSDCCCQR